LKGLTGGLAAPLIVSSISALTATTIFAGLTGVAITAIFGSIFGVAGIIFSLILINFYKFLV
jgi:hypothetical protein